MDGRMGGAVLVGRAVESDGCTDAAVLGSDETEEAVGALAGSGTRGEVARGDDTWGMEGREGDEVFDARSLDNDEGTDAIGKGSEAVRIVVVAIVKSVAGETDELIARACCDVEARTPKTAVCGAGRSTKVAGS